LPHVAEVTIDGIHEADSRIVIEARQDIRKAGPIAKRLEQAKVRLRRVFPALCSESADELAQFVG
jgi:hypothetical protein